MPQEIDDDFRYKWMRTDKKICKAEIVGKNYVFKIPVELVKHNKLKDGDWIITRKGKNKLQIESRKEAWGLERPPDD